jgi:hypothetical protein
VKRDPMAAIDRMISNFKLRPETPPVRGVAQGIHREARPARMTTNPDLRALLDEVTRDYFERTDSEDGWPIADRERLNAIRVEAGLEPIAVETIQVPEGPLSPIERHYLELTWERFQKSLGISALVAKTKQPERS